MTIFPDGPYPTKPSDTCLSLTNRFAQFNWPLQKRIWGSRISFASNRVTGRWSIPTVSVCLLFQVHLTDVVWLKSLSDVSPVNESRAG